MIFNHNSFRTTQRQVSPRRWAVAATAVFSLLSGSCSHSPNVITQAAQDNKLHVLPKGTACPKHGHPFTGSANETFPGQNIIHLLLGPVNPSDPDAPEYSLHITAAYNVGDRRNWVVCGTDGTLDEGQGNAFRFEGNAVVSKAAATALVGIVLTQ